MSSHSENPERDIVPAEAPSTSPPTVRAADYNKMVGTAHLRDIKLVTSEFKLEPDGLSDEETFKQSHACEIDQSFYDAEKELLIAWVNAHATCAKDGKTVVSVRCRYVAVYSVDGHPEELAVTAFAKRVARFAVYPYFRAHFAGIASQAGLSLPPLPIMKEKKYIPAAPAQNQIEHAPTESS